MPIKINELILQVKIEENTPQQIEAPKVRTEPDATEIHALARELFDVWAEKASR